MTRRIKSKHRNNRKQWLRKHYKSLENSLKKYVVDMKVRTVLFPLETYEGMKLIPIKENFIPGIIQNGVIQLNPLPKIISKTAQLSPATFESKLTEYASLDEKFLDKQSKL